MKKAVLAAIVLFVMAGSTVLADTATKDAEVPDSALGVRPLLVGMDVPDVSLRTVSGEAKSLKETLAGKPAVVIFYRGGWCPYCSRHLAELQKSEQPLLDMGYQIIAVSPDKPEKLSASMDKEKLSYTLLSDSKLDAAKAFGVAFKVDDATLEQYKTYKIDLTEHSGESHHLLPVPSVFIVGADGTIRFQYVNPDYSVRLDPDVLLAAAKAATKDKKPL